MNIFWNHWVIVLACYALSEGGFAADVLTYHNDNAQAELNPQESTLTPQRVNANSFGLIRNLPVDGAVNSSSSESHAEKNPNWAGVDGLEDEGDD